MQWCGALGDKRPIFYARIRCRLETLFPLRQQRFSLRSDAFEIRTCNLCGWSGLGSHLAPGPRTSGAVLTSIAPVPILDRIRCGDAWGKQASLFFAPSDLGVGIRLCRRKCDLCVAPTGQLLLRLLSITARSYAPPSESNSFAVGGAVGFASTPVRQYPGAVRLTLDVPHRGAGDAWPPRASAPYCEEAS